MNEITNLEKSRAESKLVTSSPGSSSNVGGSDIMRIQTVSECLKRKITFWSEDSPEYKTRLSALLDMIVKTGRVCRSRTKFFAENLYDYEYIGVLVGTWTLSSGMVLPFWYCRFGLEAQFNHGHFAVHV